MSGYEVATLSRIGRRRRNEDRYGEAASSDGARTAWMVADGLGGHPSGDIAAESAVHGAAAYIASSSGGEAPADLARGCLVAAQDALVAARTAEGGHAQMASTLVLAVADGASLAWGHVGDSRLYRMRDGAAQRLTRDHTMAETMRALAGRADDDDALPEHGNALLSSIGDTQPHYDVGGPDAMRHGDVYLLCSDGLWARTSNATLAAELHAASSVQDWLDRLAACVERAAYPSQDNFTAVAFALSATR